MVQMQIPFKKTLIRGAKHRKGKKRGFETIILRTGFHTLQAHHAVILHNKTVLQVFCDGLNTHIAYPVAIPAPGTVFTLLIQPQKSNAREEGVKGTHGTEKAEEAFFKKRTHKKHDPFREHFKGI